MVYQSFLAGPEFDGLVRFNDSGSDGLLDNHLLAWNVGPCRVGEPPSIINVGHLINQDTYTGDKENGMKQKRGRRMI